MGGEYQHRKTGMEKVADDLAKLQAQVEAQRKALVNLGLQVDPDTHSLVVGGGRGIQVQGGTLTVDDADGHLIGVLGTGPTGHSGIEIARPDGSPSFSAVTTDGGFAALYDRVPNYIVTDDATSGQGLARPYIPVGVWTENTVPTVTTTSSTFTTLQSLVMYKQHPKLLMQVLVNAVSPGEVRVIDQDGHQIGSTQVFTAGQFQYVQIQGSLPGAHMLPVSLNLQARITSGSSPIGVRGVTAIGVESGAF